MPEAFFGAAGGAVSVTPGFWALQAGASRDGPAGDLPLLSGLGHQPGQLPARAPGPFN